MLEGLMKGLAVWLYGLLLEIVEFIADSLLEVFNMDLAYFETNVPVTSEIVKIIMAAGWAILIGNLTFQAIKSMMSGIGFEGEDPKILFCRTFVFSFLLVASRQICEVGLGIASRINTLLQIPNSVSLGLPPLDVFAIPGSWLLVIIMGVIVMVQIVKFFFEIAERYVVLAVLTILSPLAFGVGGSKNTEDIFKGWARIFGASCLMMVFNTVFLKLLLSAMSNVPSGAGMLPWMLLVVAIARVARKIDDIVARIGLNTARTGDPISHGGIMYPIMVIRTLSGIVGKTVGGTTKAAATPKSGTRGGGIPKSPPPPPAPASGGNNPPNSPAGSGGSAAPPPPSGPASGGAPYSDIDNNAKPTRPPVGVRGDISGRNRGTAPTPDSQEKNTDSGISRGGGAGRSSVGGFSRNGEEQSRGAGNGTGRYGEMSGKHIDDMRDGSVHESNGTQATLSADTKTAGASIPQKPISGVKGNQRGSQFGKKVNIDIYRDDDAPARSSQARPTAAGSVRPPVPRGGASVQSATAQSAGATAAVKSPQANPQPTAATAQRSSNSGMGESGGARSQIPPAPMNAASPRGGRISGGISNPSDSHRAPSKSVSVISSGTSSVKSSVQTDTSQIRHSESVSSRFESTVATTKASQLQNARIPTSAPPSPAPASGQQASNPTRYRIADRSIRGNSTSEHRVDGHRPSTPARHRQTGNRPMREQENKNKRQNTETRNVPPASTGRPPSGKPPTRR